MLTYAVIGGITIASGLVEKTCRDKGNIPGALAAKKFGHFFLLGAGSWITLQLIMGMIGILL